MQMIHEKLIDTRFDLYMQVHKGLRAFMSDVLTTVGRIDPDDAIEITAGIAAVRGLVEICREHLFKENQFIHTAMEARRRGSACAATNDHVQQEEAFEQLETRLLRIERSSETDRGAHLLELYQVLALFVADNFKHMDVEEHDNNETLWSLYSDEELHRIHLEILESVAPEKMRRFLRWILPYATHPERVTLLEGMRQAMPEPAFGQVLSSIRPHLRDRDWSKLAQNFDQFVCAS